MFTFSSFICNHVSLILSAIGLLLVCTGVLLFYNECSFRTSLAFALIGCVCLAVTKYYESRSWVDAIVVFGLVVGVWSIWEGVQSSKESLDKTYRALYPQDFRAGLNHEAPVAPSDSEIHAIKVTKPNLGYEHYGFHVRLENSSPQFPAQNVFVRVFFEEDAFILAEQENNKKSEEQERLETSNDNEKILRAIRKKWKKPPIHTFTIDPLPLEPRITGEAKDKKLIGIGFLLPVIWNKDTIENYLPIEVSLRDDNGLIAIMANENKFIFRYKLQKG